MSSATREADARSAIYHAHYLFHFRTGSVRRHRKDFVQLFRLLRQPTSTSTLSWSGHVCPLRAAHAQLSIFCCASACTCVGLVSGAHRDEYFVCRRSSLTVQMTQANDPGHLVRLLCTPTQNRLLPQQTSPTPNEHTALHRKPVSTGNPLVPSGARGMRACHSTASGSHSLGRGRRAV
jgi:hypothetical protein